MGLSVKITPSKIFPSPPVGEGKGGGIIARARTLRKNLTEAEKRLWYWLRRKNLNGARFRKQAPVGKYIADFACFEPKLIIELDGSQHALQHKYDAPRDAWLRSQGFQILRIWNNEVMENMDGVLETIASALQSPPTLTLPHKGGGNS